MKKSAFLAALGLIGIGLSGCPIYEEEGCYDDYDCEYGYLCDAHSGTCYDTERPDIDDEKSCRKPSDCEPNQTCSRFGACSSGDCHYSSIGCVEGYVCALSGGRYACVADASNGGDGGAAAGGAAAGGAAAGGEAGEAGAGGQAASGAGSGS